MTARPCREALPKPSRAVRRERVHRYVIPCRARERSTEATTGNPERAGHEAWIVVLLFASLRGSETARHDINLDCHQTGNSLEAPRLKRHSGICALPCRWHIGRSIGRAWPGAQRAGCEIALSKSPCARDESLLRSATVENGHIGGSS